MKPPPPATTASTAPDDSHPSPFLSAIAGHKLMIWVSIDRLTQHFLESHGHGGHIERRFGVASPRRSHLMPQFRRSDQIEKPRNRFIMIIRRHNNPGT